MKKYLLGVAILILGLVYIARPLFLQKKPATVKQSMKLTSSAFEHNQNIPVLYTCDGKGMHPPLSIAAVPEGTKSLAIIVDDPDAPGGTFTHWVIWNINPGTTAIPESIVPQKSQEGTNSAGGTGFVSPCPPRGQHRYFFTLFALDSTLGLDGKATKRDVEKAMAGHVMAQSLLVGVYSR